MTKEVGSHAGDPRLGTRLQTPKLPLHLEWMPCAALESSTQAKYCARHPQAWRGERTFQSVSTQMAAENCMSRCLAHLTRKSQGNRHSEQPCSVLAKGCKFTRNITPIGDSDPCNQLDAHTARAPAPHLEYKKVYLAKHPWVASSKGTPIV